MPQAGVTRKKVKRRKTGCSRCRASHTKCDEKSPRCGRCERLDFECQPSDFIVPSTWCAGEPPEIPNTVIPEGLSCPKSTWDIFNNSVTPLSNIPPPRQQLSPADEKSLPLDAEKVALLQKYQSGIATWVDLFDNDLNFQRTAVKWSLTSPLMMNAICALTARQLSMVDHSGSNWNSSATRYYGESLHHLIKTLADPAASQEVSLAATILLSSYELLVSPGLDHRRHVSGALTLIRTYGCTASSGGLMGASFWVYARQDVAMALVHERPTMLRPREWDVSGIPKETAEDALANQLIWIIAKIIAFTFQEGEELSNGLLCQQRNQLLKETDAWFNSLPTTFHGIPYGGPSKEGFIKYWFAVPMTAAAMCMYHLSQILLFCEGCNARLADEHSTSNIQKHAYSIASICFSPISDGALVQGVQPLYYAAKNIDYFAKKVKIWSLLDHIENQLGFHTNNRVMQLQQQLRVN